MRLALATALLVALAAAPAQAALITHAGRTSQGARARVVVDDEYKTVARVAVGYRSRCGRGTAVFRPAPTQEPTFRYARRHRGGVARVTGHWGADGTWRGTFRATIRRGGRRCRVRTVAWEAAPPAWLEPGRLRSDFIAPRGWHFEVHSEPGEYVGGGASRSYDPPHATVMTVRGRTALSFAVLEEGGTRWGLHLDGPFHEPLAARRYAPVVASRGERRPEPGLSVEAGDRRCSQVDGEFTVERIAFARDGALREIAVSFLQRCDGRPEALRGRFEMTAR